MYIHQLHTKPIYVHRTHIEIQKNNTHKTYVYVYKCIYMYIHQLHNKISLNRLVNGGFYPTPTRACMCTEHIYKDRTCIYTLNTYVHIYREHLYKIYNTSLSSLANGVFLIQLRDIKRNRLI